MTTASQNPVNKNQNKVNRNNPTNTNQQSSTTNNEMVTKAKLSQTSKQITPPQLTSNSGVGTTNASSSTSLLPSKDNLLKLQTLKLRKFELERLLSEKTELLQQIQNQEAEILSGNFVNRSHQQQQNERIKTPINYINQNKNGLPSVSPSSLKKTPNILHHSTNVYRTEENDDNKIAKSDLLSVLSFDSENNKTKLKEKQWFDSCLDGPIIKVDHSSIKNALTNNKGSSSHFLLCKQESQLPQSISFSSPHEMPQFLQPTTPHVQQETCGTTPRSIHFPLPKMIIGCNNSNSIYNLHLGQFNLDNHINNNSNNNNNNNNIPNTIPLRQNHSVKINPQLLMTYNVEAVKNNFYLSNNSDSLKGVVNSSTRENNHGISNGNYNHFNRNHRDRDRLKLSSQSMSNGSNNYYKMHAVKLDERSHLSISTSVLNGNALINSEKSSVSPPPQPIIPFSTPLVNRHQKINKVPLLNSIPGNNNFDNYNKINTCISNDNFVNIKANLIPDPEYQQLTIDCENANLKWNNKIYHNFNNEKELNISPVSLPLRGNNNNLNNINKYSTISLPSHNSPDNSYMKNITHLRNSHDNGPPQNQYNSKATLVENYNAITVKKNPNTIVTSTNFTNPCLKIQPINSTNNSMTAIPAQSNILATCKSLTQSPTENILNETNNKNVTVVQQASFMPYKEESKPFEMSDFYKYSTKFRQLDQSLLTTNSINSATDIDQNTIKGLK